MYVKNIIKNLGGALKKLALQSYPMSRQETSFAAKTAAKSFSTYAKDYSTHEALRLQEAEDKNKQAEKTSTALAENQEDKSNQKLSEAIKDFKLETGQILNGAGSSSHSFPGSRDKSDFEKESGLTIEEFDELVEQGAKNKEDTHWHELMRYPLHLLPKKFHGKLLNYSIMEKNTDVFKQLIFEKGLDVNAGDKYDNTPLFVVADIGTAEMAKILLEQGALPKSPDDILNPYGVASSRGEAPHGTGEGIEILKLIYEKYPPDKEIAEEVAYNLDCKGRDDLHELGQELLGYCKDIDSSE